MKKITMPQDQVFWYLSQDYNPSLRGTITADVVIVGGGMAGISAAQAWHERGKKVVVIESTFCGAGASGKSSGFITPNAELSFTDFINLYGKPKAKLIWDFIGSGVQQIKKNIHEHKLECEYVPENTLVLANTKRATKKLKEEFEHLQEMGYRSAYVPASHLPDYINSHKYHGAVEYFGSFGINAYLYCQEMKQILMKQGVAIYEETPAVEIKDHSVHTPQGLIHAERIIVCTDHFIRKLGLLKKEIYPVQTFLMISNQLQDEQIKALFPHKKYMAWDTDLIYQYFRVTSEKRLILGGGDYFTAYAGHETHNYSLIVKKLSRYWQEKFPRVPMQFDYRFPGLIGISKDIAPLAGQDKDKKSVYYVGAAAGLPIACALGRYSAEHYLDGRTELDESFSPYRHFLIEGALQSILGNRISFALSNLKSELGF